MRTLILVFLAALLAVPGTALGAEKAEKKKPLRVEPVFFRTGAVIMARVMELKGSKLRLLIEKTTPLAMGVREVAPAQIYFLRLRNLALETVQARHELADFCQKEGLAVFAAREFDRIGKVSPSLKDVVKIWLSKLALDEPARLYAQGWDGIAARDYRCARDRFRTLAGKHPEHDLAKRASKLLPSVIRLVHMGRADLLRGLSDQTQKLVVYVEDKVEGVRSEVRKARQFLKGGNVTRARDTFNEAEKALVLGRKIYQLSYKGCKTREGRVFLRRRLKNLDQRLAELYGEATAFYIELRSWRKAKEKVERGLALDKGNGLLRKLAAEINRHVKSRSK